MTRSHVDDIFQHYHPRSTEVIACIFFLYSLVRLVEVVMTFFLSTEMDLYYLTRQLIYTISWFAVAYFLMSWYWEQRDFATQKIKTLLPYMERTATFSMIACIATGIVLIAYNVLHAETDTIAILTVGNILEIIAWFSMAVFFFFFRFRHRQAREELEADNLTEQQRQDAEFEELLRKL